MRSSGFLNRKNTVSLYYYIQNDNSKMINVFVEIDKKGDIFISVDGSDILKEELMQLCLFVLNTTMKKIIKIIDPARIMYNEVPEFTHDDIRILEIKYKIKFHNITHRDIKKACQKYFKTIFQVHKVDTNMMSLNYKRVSNYNKMDDMYAYNGKIYIIDNSIVKKRNAMVIKMIQKQQDKSSILQKLKFYVNQDEEEANKILSNIYSQLKIEDHLQRDGEKQRRIHVKHNPGLYIQFDSNSLTIHNINHFDYMYHLKMFLSNLLFIASHMDKKEEFNVFFGISAAAPNVILDAPEVEHVPTIEEDVEEIAEEEAAEEENVFGNSNMESFDGMNDDSNDNNVYSEEPFESRDDLTYPTSEMAASPIDSSIKNKNENTLDLLSSKPDNEEVLQQKSVSEKEEEPEVFDAEDQASDDEKSVAAAYSENEDADDDEGELSNADSYVGGAMYSLHPNPFSEKIRTKRDKKDSGLAWFDKTKKGIQNQYSKKCQWNRRRIPVILNEKEKDDIEEKVPGFFDENEVLQYSTNPLKEKLYFTCPRYWDLRTNLPIKPENVNKEDIIDNEAIKKKRVDLNKQHIIEFAENGIYKKMFPGFFDSFKNDNGFFIPCCFTKQGKQFKERIKDAEQQMKAIKEANLTDEEEIKLFLDERKKNKSQSNITEQYILYRFPLEPNRYGYLPKSLEDFFNISNLDCDKKSTPCLLRKGPESSHTKSFLGCLSILFLKSKPSIQKMIQHIKDKLTLDHILRFHGGNIPSIFYNESQLKEVDLEKYKDTKLYKKYT